jgi:hypothetical protein
MGQSSSILMGEGPAWFKDDRINDYDLLNLIYD